MKSAVMARSLFAALTIIFMTVPVYAQNSENPDAVIARVWLERASGLLNSENNKSQTTLNQAADALDIALEYQNPPGRDALYLKAKLLILDKSAISMESPARQAYALLAASLEDHSKGDFPDVTDFENRAVLWSSLALQLKDYRGLLDRYSSWPRGIRNSPVLMYAASRAALYLGLENKSGELAAEGEALSVPGTDLQVLSPSFPSGAQPAFRAVAIASGRPQSVSTLSAAWNRWPESLEAALRPWLLSGTIDVASTGNLAELLSPEMIRLLNLDIDALHGRNGDLALLRRMRKSDSVLGKQKVDNLLSGFTGFLESDADYDGYPEETVSFINGRTETRVIDKDQDGLSEWYITYEKNKPWRIQYLNSSGILSLVYDEPNYPSLLLLTYREGIVNVELSFNPGAFSWEAEGEQGFWLEPIKPVAPEWDAEKLWSGTRTVTYTAENPDNSSFGVSETVLADGYPLRAIEKVYSDKESQNLLWIREILYEDGVPAAGRRSFQGNNLWELYERYENGLMVGLAWDPGMTGTPVYLKDWALERYLETQIWDLDSDGWIDVRRFLMPNGDVKVKKLLVTEAGSEDLLPWNAADWPPWEQ
ncbi:MAG: hypothetical protein DRP60_16020 [Spirochaetes bacterium]|nr:MAG: hypothetical protein DRP60_16020 [Spirochaetota bacterium]